MRPKVLLSDTGPVRRIKVLRAGARCGCPKQAYTSRKLASQAAAITRRDRGEHVEAYHCSAGHCWHIGHPPGLHSRRSEAS